MAKILLVNPNRYLDPPVPPIGLEYLAGALEHTSHEYELLDLTFSDCPADTLRAAAGQFRPDLAGITVRNIDNGMYFNSLFFLDEFAALVKILSELGIPVVAGGAGFAFAPGEIMRYLGVRWAVDGPGEGILPNLLDSIDRDDPPPPGAVMDGWAAADVLTVEAKTGRVSRGTGYGGYLHAGGVAGFRTQTGCRGKCPYCAEANRRVVARPPAAVVNELKQLAGRGVRSFHLCDSEFNQDLDYSNTLLAEMSRAELGIEWALYMRAGPSNETMFRGLAASGANLITFTFPSYVPDEPGQIVRAVSLARDNGIRVAVDYLCGFPGQSSDNIARELDTLRAAAPDTVGVNTCIRLYPGTPTSRRVLDDPSCRSGLLGEINNNPGFLKPVYYSGIGLETIKELVGNDPLFKIEGFERSTNYQRLRQ